MLQKIIYGFSICLILLINKAKAQELIPLDGASINYTEIMFEYPEYIGADKYHLYIKRCVNNDCVDLFDSLHLTQAVMINGIFEFGSDYRWSYKAIIKDSVVYSSDWYTFKILKSDLVNHDFQKIEIHKNGKSRIKDGLIFLDGFKTAIRYDGTPVWFLPGVASAIGLRDMEITPAGTVTYLMSHDAIEVNINGEELWRAPEIEGTTVFNREIYHHEFSRLRNGHYIVAGKILVSQEEDEGVVVSRPHVPEMDFLSDIIAEFNSSGELIWSYKVLPEIKKRFGIFPTAEAKNARLLGHMNGITVDKDDSIIYASFKNFNAVFKIKKSSHEILQILGNQKIRFTDSTQKSDLFAQQHCPIILKNGNLLLFDNGNKKEGSGIVEIKTGKSKKTKKVWDYRIKKLGVEMNYAPNMGSVQVLPDEDILSSMGCINTVFEINRAGDPIWHANTFFNSGWPNKTAWEPQSSYRIKWSSSLYPSYFTIQHASTKDSINLKSGISFYINNEGTEDDEYEIIIMQPQYNIILKSVITRVSAQNSKLIEIKSKELSKLTLNTEVSISVKSSSSQKAREFYFFLKQ